MFPKKVGGWNIEDGFPYWWNSLLTALLQTETAFPDHKLHLSDFEMKQFPDKCGSALFSALVSYDLQ